MGVQAKRLSGFFETSCFGEDGDEPVNSNFWIAEAFRDPGPFGRTSQ